MLTTTAAIMVMVAAGSGNPSGDTLTIQQAVEAACENRVEITQSELSVSSAEAGLLRSTLWFTPSISASAGINGMETEFPENESYSSSIGLSGNMNLFNLQSIGGRRTSSVAADIAVESARTSRAAVIMDAASAWYSLLQAQTALELAELNLSTQEAAFELVEAKYDAGMVSRYEYLAGHVALENTRPAYVAASADLDNALGYMCLATGIDDCAGMQLEGSLADPLPVTVPSTPDELGEMALAGSAEARMARLSLESAETQTFTAWAGYAPTINLNGSVTWGKSVGDLSDLGDQDLTRTTTAGVSVNLPVFSSFANETAVKTARYSELTAELELERVEEEVVQSALETWNGYHSAAQRLTGADALVLEAQEALEIAEITYQAGSITRLDLEQSILGLMSARESRSEARLSMRMAELNVAMLTGEIHEIWEVE